MTSVNDLLRELRTHLGVAVSYTTKSQADDVYEGFLFAQVVATARRSGAAIHYEDVHGNKVNRMEFRTSPTRLYSTRRDYTHAVITFGQAPTLEAHVGVQVQGASGVLHECDVVVLDAGEAALCRRRRANPRAFKCLLAIECKYYTASGLELGLARGFAGLSADLGSNVRPLFVANIASDSVTKYLVGRKIDRELNVVPGAPEIDGVQHLIREAFKTHVGKGDPSYRI
jgi:hypothetical protein